MNIDNNIEYPLEQYILERHNEGATIEDIAFEVGLDAEVIEDIVGYAWIE